MNPIALIQQLTQEIVPETPEIKPSGERPSHIRCLALDVYGTLFTSHSPRDTTKFWQDLDLEKSVGEDLLIQLISDEHRTLKETSHIAFPEVDIREIWERLLQHTQRTFFDIEELALRYEFTRHPVWPMPGVTQLLDYARTQNWTLALVSNAQFYTPLTFTALLGHTPEELDFAPDLTLFSYQHRQAKPGLFLYQTLIQALAQRNILPEETLYLGNDVSKDILPASQLGLRTGLFAGCARSLKLSSSSTDLHRADLILTHFAQLTRPSSP